MNEKPICRTAADIEAKPPDLYTEAAYRRGVDHGLMIAKHLISHPEIPFSQDNLIGDIRELLECAMSIVGDLRAEWIRTRKFHPVLCSTVRTRLRERFPHVFKKR